MNTHLHRHPEPSLLWSPMELRLPSPQGQDCAIGLQGPPASRGLGLSFNSYSVRENSGRSEHLKYYLTCLEIHRAHSHRAPCWPPRSHKDKAFSSGLPSHLCPIQAAFCGEDRIFVLKDLGQRMLPSIPNSRRFPGEVNTQKESGFLFVGDVAKRILTPPCIVFCFSYFSSAPFSES